MCINTHTYHSDLITDTVTTPLSLAKESMKAPHVAEHRVTEYKDMSVPVWTVWWRHWYAGSPLRCPLCHLQVPEAVAGRRWVVLGRCRAGGEHTARYMSPVLMLQVVNSGEWCGNYENNMNTSIRPIWSYLLDLFNETAPMPTNKWNTELLFCNAVSAAEVI
jgi:hypothetical protein